MKVSDKEGKSKYIYIDFKKNIKFYFRDELKYYFDIFLSHLFLSKLKALNIKNSFTFYMHVALEGIIK